jgi:tetratricopeptide (TPR) repeat protein/tRNA A-37 threonylcarbamoyl transferase component Bud32
VNSGPPADYEELSPEAAARVDAVCDRFEQAWKEVGARGEVPILANFLEGFAEHERSLLAEELIGLDRACRERYGVASKRADGHGGNRDDAFENAATLAGHGSTRPRFLDRASWPRIPGLEVLALLGSGGMGVVFRARQTTLDREVAVKLLRDARVDDDGKRNRFLQEAQAIARLHHPNLVQLYEFGELPAVNGMRSQPYLVLEYVPGGNLADQLRNGPLFAEEAARIVASLAVAVDYAHQRGVIHRDLKPANVLLASGACKRPESSNDSPRGLHPPLAAVPKITDFGLAKFLSGPDLTKTGDVVGTPSYMAPEQLATKNGPITPAVDVYGLGAILYESLTGRPPFIAETVVATMGLVKEDDPIPPRQVQPGVSRDLEIICLKCLQKSPQQRYSTAEDLARDLRRYLAGEPIRARPVGMMEGVIRWCRRRPLVAGLLAALVLVFFAGLTAALGLGQIARQHASRIEQDQEIIRQNSARFEREQQFARMEKDRAERNLRMLRQMVDRMKRLGQDLGQHPQLHETALLLLEQTVAFYEKILPEERTDPQLHREAARMYGEVANTYHSLGKWTRAVDAYRLQANLLTAWMDEDRGEAEPRRKLAECHRNRGNVLRDRGDVQRALSAYGDAVKLQEQLLEEFRESADRKVALANTLLNQASLLSPREHDEELNRLYRSIVTLEQDAVKADSNNLHYQAELALGLQSQASFLLNSGKPAEAKIAVEKALDIHQKLLAGVHGQGDIDRYVARSYSTRGRIFAVAGKTIEAKKAYEKAVELLDPQVKRSPAYPHNRTELAETLVSLANLLDDAGRKSEAEVFRRQVVGHYEYLKVRFPEDSRRQFLLVRSYLELACLLEERGRQEEADQLHRKAFQVDAQDPAIDNELAWFLANCAEKRWRNPEKAVRLAQKAVLSNPKSPGYWNTLGVARYRKGDGKGAIADLERAINLRAGGNGCDWFFLAMIHCRLGDRDEARTCLDRAVQWTDKYAPRSNELRRFRAEAERELLGSR